MLKFLTKHHKRNNACNIENARHSPQDLNSVHGRSYDFPQIYHVHIHTVGKYNSGRFHLLLWRATRGRYDRRPFSHDPVSQGESLYGNMVAQARTSAQQTPSHKRTKRAVPKRAIVTKGIVNYITSLEHSIWHYRNYG